MDVLATLYAAIIEEVKMLVTWNFPQFWPYVNLLALLYPAIIEEVKMLVTWNFFSKRVSILPFLEKKLSIPKQETFYSKSARVIDGTLVPATLRCIKNCT